MTTLELFKGLTKPESQTIADECKSWPPSILLDELLSTVRARHRAIKQLPLGGIVAGRVYDRIADRYDILRAELIRRATS